MTTATKRKPGRPPRTITSRDGTELRLRDLGITRQQASNWKAIASLPDDVFERRLAEYAAGTRKVTSRSLIRLACELGTTDRKAPMRDPTPLDDARKALAKLSRGDRIALARELVAELTR